MLEYGLLCPLQCKADCVAWEAQRKLRPHCCSEDLSLQEWRKGIYKISILQEYFFA